MSDSKEAWGGWDELKHLRAEVNRLKGNMRARLADHINGTPCAEIRWQQERETLTAEVERLRAALVTARGDLYNAANAWNDEDYRGPVPGGEGDFAAHSVASQKNLVDWICSRAEAISAALEKK